MIYKRTGTIALLLLLLGTGTGLFGCAADTSSNGEALDAEFLTKRDHARKQAEQTPQRSVAEADIGLISDALTAWRLVVPLDRRHIDGNLLEEDHYWTIGRLCDAGYVRAAPDPEGDSRVNPAVVKLGGNGACDFAGWENPSDKHDCRARIHAHTNAGWGAVNCETSVYEQLERRDCCSAHNSPGCDDSVPGFGSISECVCDNDSYCCTTAWDSFCAAEIAFFGCAPRNFCRP
jgi:hypothetical protein